MEPEGHKKNEQKGKVGTTTLHYPKFLKDGLTQDGVKNFCNVKKK
jgi:hypothetical protein